MSPAHATTKPLGVSLVTLYFAVTGFVESIQRYRDWGSQPIFHPFSERSVWSLLANTMLYLVVAYLVWRRTYVGRLAGLVYGYFTLGTYLTVAALYLAGETMDMTPLFVVVAVYHALALPPILVYLQPARRRELFSVSLRDVVLPDD